MIESNRATGLLALAVLLCSPAAFAQSKPYAGITLTLASQNDQFAPVLAKLAPDFEALTGATVKVDILDYGSLLTKTTADFIGHTKGYDLVTMDIVWSGAFAENGYTVDLTDWIKRDAAEIDTGDIYPVLMHALGGFAGKQMAFPFAGYANILAYRKDLYAKALGRIADQAYAIPLFIYGRTYAFNKDLDYPITQDEMAHFYMARWK